MLFCSERFFLFFCVVFAVYWAMPWRRARVWWLLAASFFFYASWNQWLALLIGVSTLADYLIARGLDAASNRALRRLLVSLSIVGNLGLLAYFKYANFFLQSVGDALHAAGATASLPVLQVFLPIGISFYTFEAINYTVDVYRGKVRAERNLAHFMLFITFFPHLVAGPIVRARDFLPQIRRPKRWDWNRLHLGAQLLVMGFIKKAVIADRMAAFADPVFARPDQYGTTATWIAVVAYALQIYCDFSGYTDMAIGCAHALGYKLAPNFDMPYLSMNISEFWRRWHISLSSWLRDYLFIPLGGSRGAGWRTCLNLMIVMTLGGLWHGASWTFAAWGALHGGLLIAHRGFRAVCERRSLLDRMLRTPPGMVLRAAATFLAVCAGWVFFRSPTFAGAAWVFRQLVVRHHGMGPPMEVGSFWALAAATVVCHGVGRTGLWKALVGRLPAPVLGCGYAAAMVLALLLMPDGGNRVFIYFQF